MRRARRVLVAGLTTGAVVGLFEAAARSLAGIPLPAELFSDWFLPMLPVDTFLSFLGRLGGPLMAKALAYWGAFAFIVVAVVVAAVAWQWLRRRRWGSAVASGVVVIVGIVVLAVLFPVLVANYAGVPEPWAAITSAAGLVATLAIAVVLIRTLDPPSEEFSSSRRELLTAGAGFIALAATGGLAVRLFEDGTFSYDGARLSGIDRTPITPVGRFYIVTKNLIDPDVDDAFWRLDVGGLVGEPYSLAVAELRALPAQTQETTLECISNGVGYGLLSNGVWTGPTMRSLIERARPSANARFVELQGADGYVYTLPLDHAMRKDVMVAHSMNGAPLTRRHGAPARAIVPGVYGEGNPKWLTHIMLRDHDQPGYYALQGWVNNFVQTTSVIDQPGRNQVVQAGTAVTVNGVAFAGDRGVSRVEISPDDGQSWLPARLTYAPSPLAWVLWSADWTPATSGMVMLTVRAYDGAGTLQESNPHGFAPAGAAGLHRVEVHVA